MITIVSAYADLMNLYGDYANAEALKRRLNSAGQPAEIRHISVGNEFDLSGCDLLYIGAGTEPAMLTALKDIEKNGDQIRDYLQSGGKILATGNAAALLAQSISFESGETFGGLALCDYEVLITGKRRYAEYIMTTPLIEREVVGATNASIEISESASPMFAVTCCTGSWDTRTVEGYCKDGIYVTELCGPLLVRNPALLEYFAALLCGGDLPLCDDSWLAFARAGYDSVLDTLKKARGTRRKA